MAGRSTVSKVSKLSIIDKSSMLGAGSYGAVYIARWNHLKCAAKVIHASLFMFDVPGKPNIAEQFKMECEFISRFRHPNLVQFLGMDFDSETVVPVLLMELMDRSLTKLLEGTTSLSHVMQLSICHDVSLAITYLHSERFIHRDISSNNVLMKGSLAKLTDLGVSVLIDSTKSNRLTQCPGTEVYMPPDSVSDSPNYTEKIDCFSFGVLALQIVTCEYPKASERMVVTQAASDGTSEMLRRVPEVERRREQLSMVPEGHSLLQLIRKCLKDKETERPTAEEICCYVAHLKEIEEAAASVRAQASGASQTAAEEEESRVRQLKASLEECYSTVARLQSEGERNRAEISRLQQENNLLAASPVSTQVYETLFHKCMWKGF